MGWLDDFHRIVSNGYGEQDWRRLGETCRCPVCQEPLTPVAGRTTNGRDCFRFACSKDRSHHMTRWHTSWKGAYEEAAGWAR